MSTSTTEQIRVAGADTLVKTRMTKNLSIEVISKKTRIPERYIKLFEEKTQLPKDAYTTIYLKAYCKFLGVEYVNYAKNLVDMPAQTSSANTNTPKVPPHQFTKIERRHPKTAINTGEMIAVGAIGRKILLSGIVLAAIGYLGWTLYAMVVPPKLALLSPTQNSTSENPRVTVQGIATPESAVTINGKSIPVDSHGNFTDHIDLATGQNTITVTAKKKYGKPTTIERSIVVTPTF